MENKKQKLIVEIYEKRLLSLCNNEDLELIHLNADNLLLDVLRELGFEKISDAYEKVSEVGFWYS